MDDKDRRADHTEDPREQESAGGGYPESAPAGSEDDDARGGRDRSGGDVGSDAPSPASVQDSDRDTSTGNPRAAG